MDAVFDVVILFKEDFRRIADNHALPQLMAHETRRLFQRRHHGRAVGFLQNADVDLGVAQIARHLSPRHAEGATNTRIGQAIADDAVHLAANLL